MERIEQLAEAALQRDSLRLRSLVQEMIYANINWSAIPLSEHWRRVPAGNFSLACRTIGGASKSNASRLDKRNWCAQRTFLLASFC